MNWSDKVKNLMRQKGYNQKDLARESGITEPSVSRYLRGERTPRIDIIVNFARALDVDINYLLTDEKKDGIQDIKAAIARHGNTLTKEEQEELIDLIRGNGSNV